MSKIPIQLNTSRAKNEQGEKQRVKGDTMYEEDTEADESAVGSTKRTIGAHHAAT